MRSIVLVEKETGNSFEQVMNMPYIIYLCHLYWVQQLNLESYQDQLSMFSFGAFSPTENKQEIVTEPDWNRLKKLGGGG